MKTNLLIIVACLGLNPLYYCSLAQDNKIIFGIYETRALKELHPLSEKMSKYILNQDLSMDSPVIGYTSTPGMSHFESLLKESGSTDYNLMSTRFSATNRGISRAIISLQNKPFIDISDVKTTIAQENAVEVRFTFRGSKRWAKMTKTNTGKSIAFVVNNEIWSLPVVNAEIRSGVALITGIEDKETAEKLSAMLNKSIKD